MTAPAARDLRVEPIQAAVANLFIDKHHYSHKHVRNSQVHFGVFLNRKLEGVMQFGPSMDKRKTMALVSGTGWNGFLELNRLAFTEALPKNSESRAIAYALRLIKKRYPQIKWVISFADGTQCGDGTIYRASGFVLTGIKKNTTIWALPNGVTFSDLGVRTGPKEASRVFAAMTMTKGSNISENGAASMKRFRDLGAAPLAGFQLRYVYFLDPEARKNLTVAELPFAKIKELGATMFRGKRPDDLRSKHSSDAPGVLPGEGGSIPTRALRSTGEQGLSKCGETEPPAAGLVGRASGPAAAGFPGPIGAAHE